MQNGLCFGEFDDEETELGPSCVGREERHNELRNDTPLSSDELKKFDGALFRMPIPVEYEMVSNFDCSWHLHI